METINTFSEISYPSAKAWWIGTVQMSSHSQVFRFPCFIRWFLKCLKMGARSEREPSIPQSFLWFPKIAVSCFDADENHPNIRKTDGGWSSIPWFYEFLENTFQVHPIGISAKVTSSPKHLTRRCFHQKVLHHGVLSQSQRTQQGAWEKWDFLTRLEAPSVPTFADVLLFHISSAKN